MSRVPTLRPVPYYAAIHSSRLVETPWPRMLRTVRKFTHGAGSALLVFAGADSLTAATSAAQIDDASRINLTTIDGVAQSLLSGALAGPLQVAGAAFLFLAAGKCTARLLGLLAAGAAIFLYLQGVALSDVVAYVERFAARLSAAQTAFMTTDVLHAKD